MFKRYNLAYRSKLYNVGTVHGLTYCRWGLDGDIPGLTSSGLFGQNVQKYQTVNSVRKVQHVAGYQNSVRQVCTEVCTD